MEWSISEMIIGRGKLKLSEKTLSKCHSVNHKSHMDYPGIKSGLP
jgi:hypothetical protein